jgi:hypothetical protein
MQEVVIANYGHLAVTFLSAMPKKVKAGKAPALTLGIIFPAYQQSGNLHHEWC